MSKSAKKAPPKNRSLPEFVEVVLPIPLRQTFTYRIPSGLREGIRVGARLLVPFGKRQITGYAVVLRSDLPSQLSVEKSAIKDVIELLDVEPLVNAEILKLTQWASDYYVSSWGEVLKASLPAGINAAIDQIYSITPLGREELKQSSGDLKYQILNLLDVNGEKTKRELVKLFGKSQTDRVLRQVNASELVSMSYQTTPGQTKPKFRKAVKLAERDSGQGGRLTDAQLRIIEILRKNEWLFFTDLLERAETGSSPVNTLVRRGVVEIFERDVRRDPLGDSELPRLESFVLTDQQVLVLSAINQALAAAEYAAFLLHGVTGSGKTEVYIEAMKRVLEMGKSALMLVPEIALTPVFSKRLRTVFGDSVAIFHSALSAGARFDEWTRIRTGQARIVIGTRSAVFAPLRNIGLIIVDEEHDASYRQHEMPFYHGRDVAVMRGFYSDSVVVLGSATPAIESFHNASIGKYRYLSLPNRIGDRPLAIAELIDMRAVFKDEGENTVFSPQLLQAIDETHRRGEQSIILLNRRGFSSFVLCRSCGETIRCRNCEITLTYHRGLSKLICHYCNYREKAPAMCPHCQGKYLFFVGEGTEQIEGMLQRRFSHLKIARIDRDTTRKKNELEETLLKFSRGEIDMLVGTQMLAKGHDYHNVTLVGVVSVDAGLAMPDFRAAERTFQLLTQVAGRAGRGKLPGRVLIQTYHPEHYALSHARTQSYQDFYDVEVNFRRKLNYPPFVSLASILIKHPNYQSALDNAKILRDSFDKANRTKECIVLGPAPAPLARLKGEHRLQILIKSRSRSKLREIIDLAMDEAQARSCDMRIVFVEIDPINLM